MSPIKAHVGKLTKTFRRSANSRKRSIDWVTTFENLRPVLAASPCEIGQSDSAKSSQHLRPEANPLLAENLFEKGESDSARNSLRLGPEAHPLLATNLFEDEHSDTTSVISDIMASSRFSTYMDPALSLFSRLPESKAFTRRQAKQQETVIRKRLEAAGEKMPQIEFLDYIGKGSFGRVYVCRDNEKNGRQVAIKVFDVDAADAKAHPANRDWNLDELSKEYQVLKQLEGFQAENVNQVYEVRVVHDQLWIITEYCPGGSVHTVMQSSPNRKIEEKYLRVIARELAKGLRAIHKAEIIHRDIKAANVMIHEEGGIQIIDFGVAGQLESAVDKRATIVGTPHWMSPEILKDAEIKYGQEVDTWSYGITLIEMATGTAPNSGVPKHVLSKQIRLQGGPKLKAQDGYSEELCDLVAFTLVRDPKQRPSMDDILEHPYLRDTEDEYPKSLLVELIKRHDKWANAGGQRASLLQPYGAEAAEYREDPFIRGEWRFSTLESTEIMEGLGTEPLSNIEYVGNRIDPVADMTSTQAQEDSMNSYFAGETSHEVLEDFSNIEYTPGPSPRSHFDGLSAPAETVIPDEKRVRRGGHHLGALFDPNSSDYTSPALQKPTPKAKQDNSQRGPSDLPLRSQNASSTDLQRSDTETSSQGSLRSGKKIANIDTMRANRYARPTTMDWDFPQAAPAASSTLPSLPTLQSESSGASHANLNDWTPGYESDYAPSPSRPPLRNTETAPVPHDLTRGSRLDMDALLGDLGDTMPTYAYAPPQQPTFQEAGHIDTTEADDGSLDLDAMMGDLAPMNEPYHDTSDTQSSVYRGYETNDVVDTTATTPWRASIPAPPNAEAMAAGASDDVLGLELERFLGEWTSELGALGAQFAEFGVDDLSEDGEGKGSG